MNNIKHQNTALIIEDIVRVVKQINELDGFPIVYITLNGQKLQKRMYEYNKCYIRTIELNVDPQRAQIELLKLEADLIVELTMKRGGDNLCNQ